MTEHEILKQALDWRASGRDVAICTVVETWGSAPKPIGSHLIVDGDGAFLGSISGGCVEADVIVEALAVQSGGPRILEFGISDDLAWKAGLTCGGHIKILVARLDERLSSCLSRLVGDYILSKPCVLVTALDDGASQIVGFGEQTTHVLAPQIADVFATGRSELIDKGETRFFLTASMPAMRLVVVGAVHIAQALSPLAKLAGLEMTVVDPRSAFATTDRFPNERLIVQWPTDVAEELNLGPSDAVAALSHDPNIDDQGLALALAAGCFYVGALGSRRSHARRLDRLRAAGIAEQELRRIHAPIGLDIGAEGPAEIALAIVAEIISVRRQSPRRTVAVASA